jgi:hypothetical protein
MNNVLNIVHRVSNKHGITKLAVLQTSSTGCNYAGIFVVIFYFLILN